MDVILDVILCYFSLFMDTTFQEKALFLKKKNKTGIKSMQKSLLERVQRKQVDYKSRLTAIKIRTTFCGKEFQGLAGQRKKLLTKTSLQFLGIVTRKS